MFGRHTKFVSVSALIPGQKVTAVKQDRCISSFSATVVEANAGGATLNIFGEREERYPVDAQFEVEMPEEEFRDKYREDAKQVMAALCNKMANYEIGYHEMWNAWLDFDPYEIAANCKEHKIKILGYCLDIPYKAAMFSGDHLDVGICAEEDNGEKFWCHFRTAELRDMFRDFSDIAPEKDNPWTD